MKGLVVNKYGVYKLRIRVSVSAIKYFKKKEINKSLETKDKAIAISKATSCYYEYKNIIRIIKMNALTEEQIQELVNKFIKETLQQDKIDRAINGYGTVYAPSDDLYYQDYTKASKDILSDLISDYKQYLATSNFDEVEDIANTLLSSLNICIDKNERSHCLFLQNLLRAQIEIFNEAFNRYNGNFNPKYDNYIVNEKQKIQVKNQTTMTNHKAVELFLKNYKMNTSSTQYTEVSNFMNDIFIYIIIKDDNIADTTLEDILEIREILARLPKRNIQKYRNMPIEELLETIPNDNEIISSRTLNKYVKWLKMFYNFCMDNNYISKNPIISISTRSTTNELTERLPLDEKEIKKLLYVTKDDIIIQNGIKALAYSGMRLSELYKAKIRNDIKCFDLTDRSIKLKTRSSYRIIPIHNDINTELLLQLPNKDTFSKKVNSIIRKEISDDPKKVLYSLRHSFATILKNNRVQPEIIFELMGHSHQTMTFSRYANKYDIEILREAINKLQY
jgi:integrase